MDWSAPGTGSADQLWRMNLHYMEYLEAVEDGQWELLVSDWISSNPASNRGSWRDSWNSYALSIRVVVWLQELARRGHRLSYDLVQRTAKSAGEQILFLERHLETDLGGNHLMKNIKALIWASKFFSGADPQRWGRKGLALLGDQLGKQILWDGTHYERSGSYHAQVFADLLECRHALGVDPLNGRLDDTVARMAQALADLTHPDGGPALFNDAGLSMAYGPTECLSVYQRLSGRRPEPRANFALEEAGYYGLRASENYLLVDCGLVAPDDLPAHGHADILSFEWSVGGKRIVVDQGVYEYVAGPRRQQARSAASHNTLCFEGADQADFFGAFRCGRRPKAKVTSYERRGEGFMLEGTHDGFDYLPGHPRHFRRFDADREQLVITDRIKGESNRSARIAFLLHPGVEVSCSGQTARLGRDGTAIEVTSSLPFKLESAVWWPDIGVEQTTHRLVVQLAPGTKMNKIKFHIVRQGPLHFEPNS